MPDDHRSPSNKARIGPRELGIDLSDGSDAEVFKWLIACQLFGERISQDIAAKTFTELDKAGYTSPKALANADWQAVVDALGRGGYRRYDESTARELISIGKYLLEDYGGSMTQLHEQADTTKALKEKVQEFKGVGPKAAEIFLREMRDIWK
ncbi:MAG: methylase [Pseudonocardiales bacterium]|nr:methylase [Pseudonocardiales bacterium]